MANDPVCGMNMDETAAIVPLEELMCAFTFGLYWSSVYEHLAWKRSPAVAKSLPAGSPVGRAR